MFRRARSRLTYANVASSFALFIALTTGTVYAANEWTGANIVDGSLTAADLQIGTIGTGRIQDNSLGAVDLAPDSVTSSELADNSVDSAAVANESLTAADLGVDSVQATEIADNSIDGGEIIDNSLGSVDLAPNSVGTSEITDNTVSATDVTNHTITALEFVGGRATGVINLSAGFAAVGRCRDIAIGVGGSAVGDAVVISINGALPEGILIYGQRVATAGQATMKVCNLSGASMAAISNLHVAVFTIKI
jgi:hypothetical protein